MNTTLAPQILRSDADSVERWVWTSDSKSYSTVYFYDAADNSINACCSSQIGCPESCLFCATGDAPFVRNLTSAEMSAQYEGSLRSLEDVRWKAQPRLLYILLEGMGEASFNIENCFGALARSVQYLGNMFERIRFRISTAGNVAAIPSLRHEFATRSSEAIEYQFQVSLHSSLDEDRRVLIPGFGKRFPVHTVVKEFTELALEQGQKLKCNYLLLNFSGRTNYSQKHLDALLSTVDIENTRIKLTSYAETKSALSSPLIEEFHRVASYLTARGLETKIRYLVGHDIRAACGMLHYVERDSPPT